jgi:DNA-binding HxlR family transcriptional regulator
MSPMSKPVDPNCRAYQKAIDVLGRPWTGLILALLQKRALRFGELAADARGVGAKMLSSRLKELEARKIVARRLVERPTPHLVYQLTPKGRGFRRVAAALERWGRDLA